MKFCHIDTETCGLDAKVNGVIQVAGIIEINSKEVATFDHKVRPHASDVIEPEALKVSGTTMEDVLAYPDPFVVKSKLDALFARYIKKFDKKDKFWFIGYNASFDWNFMQEFYRKAEDKYFGSWFQFPFIDTACLAGIMLIDKRQTLPNFKQSTVAEALGIKFNEADLHDALADVRISKAIFDMFMTRVGVPVSDLERLCSVGNCMMRTR